ncbi:hypothetical protein HNR23_004546 [Nocardiopsis mwathae]|uniref:Uncharacterized protein n=1 Tax=Nocardiopsis mwathae TaxID=1472723 RepID=A0A7X0D879_9ACTN|nr:hypothetical protein [Nocardiopsis mwathae]MBB6174486.1 hypothetical protein [Nocardiopsis mwathae]
MAGPETTAAMWLRARYPGTVVWRGSHTERWWAMVPDHPRLLEAPSIEALELLVASRLWTMRETQQLARVLPPNQPRRSWPGRGISARSRLRQLTPV